MAVKKQEQATGHPSNQTKYEAMAADIDSGLTEVERAAVKSLADAGWVVLINPRVENSTTKQGDMSELSCGLYRIGLTKDRIRR